MAKRPYDCFGCGETFDDVTAHMIHVSRCDRPRGAGAITRPVACWSCAGDVDLRLGPVCPGCGAVYRLEAAGQ